MNVTAETVASRFHYLKEGQSEEFRSFREAAISFQREHSAVYRKFKGYTYLPVEAFKRAPVCTFDPREAQRVFESSGTGTGVTSKHYVKDISIYHSSVEYGFNLAFGDEAAIILGHLPRYAEKSSLVHMVEHLVETRGGAGSTLFLEDMSVLNGAVESSSKTGTRLILFGAAFGLLDLIESIDIPLPANAVVVETGGMKTHRREVSRRELHARLADGFSLPTSSVTSEYGMCELMSQLYMREDGLFYPPPWMEVDILDPSDPLRRMPPTEEGVLAIFDLANIYSVSAILTQDRASVHGDGIKIHGRLTGAELRGCNFLLER